MAITVHPFPGCCGAEVWYLHVSTDKGMVKEIEKKAAEYHAKKGTGLVVMMLTGAQHDSYGDELIKLGARRRRESATNPRYGDSHQLHLYSFDINKFGVEKPAKLRKKLFG